MNKNKPIDTMQKYFDEAYYAHPEMTKNELINQIADDIYSNPKDWLKIQKELNTGDSFNHDIQKWFADGNYDDCVKYAEKDGGWLDRIDYMKKVNDTTKDIIDLANERLDQCEEIGFNETNQFIREYNFATTHSKNQDGVSSKLLKLIKKINALILDTNAGKKYSLENEA